MAELYLREDFARGELAAISGAPALLSWARRTAAKAVPGDVYRDKEGRRTLRFERGGRGYFLKLHTGVGWGEIFKNLLQARAPVLDAGNEYRAALALHSIGIDTLAVAAYAVSGRNPASRASMLVTDELVATVSLEDYCADWSRTPPPAAIRMRLVRMLAQCARQMHDAGINHRDFYLCHFHLDPASLGEANPRCYLIDLHRAQIRAHTPRRWRVKDLAGLYFSAMDCGLGQRDLLRFMRHYSATGLRGALAAESELWRQVAVRAQRLYAKTHGGAPVAEPEPTHGH